MERRGGGALDLHAGLSALVVGRQPLSHRIADKRAVGPGLRELRVLSRAAAAG